ncbi:hypothetical protein BGZ60DRAFT_395690 [Tricladium varicosporioides]|nr:hypothetical protein BGZ60DRAFT_395690 [Hymenoscyphus varicosporioides]
MRHADPVTQMCLGLTSRYYHQVFHNVYNDPNYNITRYPFHFNLQMSVCESYILNWVYDDYFWKEADESPSRYIEWNPSLNDLLADERKLWGDLVKCPGCEIYKPASAYERFPLEYSTHEVFCRQIKAFLACDLDWYESQCRRCRAKFLLVVFWQKEEVLEGWWHDGSRKSVGLRVRGWGRGEAMNLDVGKEEFQVDAQYSKWEDVFTSLEI